MWDTKGVSLIYFLTNPIVLFSNSYSNKYSRPSGFKYKKEYKDKIEMSNFQKQALIGLILGDVHVSRSKPQHNTRLVFDQSKDKHSDYLNYLYNLFEPFVGTEPKSTNRKPDKRTGLTYDRTAGAPTFAPRAQGRPGGPGLIFKTLALPCFNEYHELFYPNGVKIIPNNISDYLTEVSLARNPSGFLHRGLCPDAFWIMDDGGKTTHGDLLLHTNSYTLEEVELLVSVLNNKFNLTSKKIQRKPNQWAILIYKKELDKVRTLTSAYIHSSMKYKLSL